MLVQEPYHKNFEEKPGKVRSKSEKDGKKAFSKIIGFQKVSLDT